MRKKRRRGEMRHGGCTILGRLAVFSCTAPKRVGIVGTSRRQFVLASAAIAAAMLLGGASARAGYVSVATLTEQDGVDALLLAELPATSGAAGDTTTPRPDADDPHAPAQPSSPFLKLQPAACNFGHSGAGSPSSSAPGGGSSSPPAGDLVRPQVPPLQQTSLLPPQTGDAQPFSVASFLFRPPRAA